MNEETAMREMYGPIREILEREGLEPALEALRDLPEGENDAIRDLIADLLEPTLRYTKSEAWGKLELIFTPWLEYNLSAAWQKGDSQ